MLISIVIPVYNEEQNLSILGDQILQTLVNVQDEYEIIFVNDGSKDGSLQALLALQEKSPKHIKIVDFFGNFGQHMAIMAGFEQAKGEMIITLDADLQNPPHEIPKLIAKFKEGYDYVGSFRKNRQDSLFRTKVSQMVNFFREKITNISMVDQGCMLRAYSRNIIQQIIAAQEKSTFIPALAYSLSVNPIEVEVDHNARAYGESKYNLYKLIRLNFDLITGFSMVPLQVFTIFGMGVSFLSALLVIYLMLRRLIIGPEVEGVFTLFAILFLLISVLITGVGLVGEYVGRIFQTLNNRPRYIIKKIY